MSVDFESFLWGIGFGKEEENHKTKSKAKHAIKNPILKLENLQIKNNTLTVKLRNISKKAEAVDQVTFRKILKRPKIIKKLFLKKKIVAENLTDEVWPEKFTILPGDKVEIKIKLKENLEPKNMYELRVECSVEEEIGPGSFVKYIRGLTYWLETDANKNFKKPVTMTISQANEILKRIAKRSKQINPHPH